MPKLAEIQVTDAVTGQIIDAVTGLGQPQAVSLTAQFAYTADDATSLTAWVQTSIDGGQSWWDIACFTFGTASANKYQNCSGLTAISAAVALGDGTLATDTAINGLIGDRLRVKYTSIGTYGAGTRLTVNAFSRK